MKDIEKKLSSFEQKVDSALKSFEEKNAANILGGNRMHTVSDERKLLDAFGVKGVKELLEVNVAHPRFGHVANDVKSAAIQLKNDFDCARLAAQIFNNAPAKDSEEAVSPVHGILDTKFAKMVDLQGRLKSFGTSTQGGGLEWVPTAIASTYLEEYHLAHQLADSFKTIPMPTKTFELPVQTDSKKARIVAESQAATEQQFGTEVITFDSKKLYDYYLLPEELNEDSAPAILELAKREVVQSIARAIESALLNGDTSATHMDSDVVAGDAEKAWKGLRYRALDASSVVDFGGGAFDKAKLSEMRQLMKRFGVNPRELAWVFGPSAYTQAQKLEIVESLQNFGPNATVLSGALGVYNGISVLVSEHCREDLNASGVYDGVTTNRGSILLVNTTRFMLGMRSPIRIKAAMDARPEYDRWQLVSYTRQSFAGHKQFGELYKSGSTSKERSVILGANFIA